MTEPLLIRAQQAHPRGLAETQPPQRIQFVPFRGRQARHAIEDGYGIRPAHTHPAARLDRLSALLGDLEHTHPDVGGDPLPVGLKSHLHSALCSGSVLPLRHSQEHRLGPRAGGQRELQLADSCPCDPQQRQDRDRDRDDPSAATPR